jgi:hypothetical protein
MLNRAISMLTVAAGLAFSATAAEASPAWLVDNVNLRTGPGTDYYPLAVLPSGSQVEVYGCLQGYTWCDVAYGNLRGWLSSRYLSIFYDGPIYIPYHPRFEVQIYREPPRWIPPYEGWRPPPGDWRPPPGGWRQPPGGWNPPGDWRPNPPNQWNPPPVGRPLPNGPGWQGGGMYAAPPRVSGPTNPPVVSQPPALGGGANPGDYRPPAMNNRPPNYQPRPYNPPVVGNNPPAMGSPNVQVRPPKFQPGGNNPPAMGSPNVQVRPPQFQPGGNNPPAMGAPNVQVRPSSPSGMNLGGGDNNRGTPPAGLSSRGNSGAGQPGKPCVWINGVCQVK